MLHFTSLFLARTTTEQGGSLATASRIALGPGKARSAHRLSSLVLLSALALLAGCSDNGGSSGVNDGGQVQLDDEKVFSMVEQTRYEVIPAVGTSDETSVEGWAWDSDPFRSGPLLECAGLDGFQSDLAVDTLAEACTFEGGCNFSFDQSDIVNQDGSRSPRFIIEVPTLKAPVGLSYRLRGVADLTETVTSSATFCLVPVNEAPMAENDAFTVVQGDLLVIDSSSAINLLSNDVDDIDSSNSPLSVAVTPLVAPERATQFALSSDGGFTYLFDGDLNIQGNGSVVDTFRYQITDGIFTSSADVRITIVSRNDPPVVSGVIPGHTAVVGIPTEYDFSSSFTDPEGSQLQYSLAEGSLPANSNLVSSVLGVLTGTPGQNDVGNYTVTIVASDGVSSASGNFLLTIVENQMPSATAPSDLSVDFGTLVELNVSGNFQDPEGAGLTYSLATAPESNLVINPRSGLITGALPAAGTYTITVSASDGVNDAVSSSFQITQGERPNRAPLFSGSIASQGILLGETPTPVSGDFTDPDGDTLSYAISSVPQGMAFDTSTGVLSGTPAQLGVFSLNITAADGRGGSTVSNTFSLTVSEVPNEVPSLDSPVADVDAVVGVAITPFTAQFTDPEGGSLSYTSTALPPGLTLDAQTGQVTGTPTSDGVYSVSVTAADGAGATSTSNVFTITVAEPENIPPTFTGSIDDVSVTVGTAISPIGGNFTDTEPLTYSSSALPIGISLNATTGIIAGTPTAVGTFNVSLTATDTRGGSTSSNTFVINVLDVPNNVPKFLDDIPAQNAIVGSAITPVDVSQNFSDIDVDDTLEFTVDSGSPLPPGLTLSPAGSVSGTPTTNGVFSVVVIATDDDGAAVSSAPFTFTVSDANVAPSISNRTPAGIIELVVGDSTVIDFSVADETPSSLEFTATSSSSSVTLEVINDGEYRVTGSSAGGSTLTFTVTDAQGLSDTEVVTVNVVAPSDDPPQIGSVTPSNASVTVNRGTALEVTLVASDESVSSLGYSAVSDAPDVASVVPGAAGRYTVTADPNGAAPAGGSANITLTVTDSGGQSDSYTFTVNVAALAVNEPPVILNRTPAADPLTGLEIGDTDPLIFTVSDEDTASLEYSLTDSPSGIVTIAATGPGSYSITGVAAGTTAMTFIVTDSEDQTAVEVFAIQVAEPNVAPIFGATIDDVSFPEGVPITPLDVSIFFDDPDGDALTFSSTDLPAGLDMNDGGVISGTPLAVTASTVTSVTITAFDLSGSGLGTESNGFDIEIIPASQG